MSGDFSRSTFKPGRYRAVLAQQGRVSVDADWNEQSDILNHHADETTADLLGSAARPRGGFELAFENGGITIGQGALYLGGTACRNPAPCALTAQPHLPLRSAALADLPDLKAGAGTYAVVLEAFERIVTATEEPSMRELALGGADTCVRSEWVWQVRLRRFDPAAGATCGTVGDAWRPAGPPGRMTARTVTPAAPDDACLIPPTAEYRRLDNQLYRVEIHKGGPRAQATMKWSRENGSVLTAVLPRAAGETETAGPVLSVASVGRDADLGFGVSQWVELADETTELGGAPLGLLQVKSVDAAASEIELTVAAASPVRHALKPKLRRWDQRNGGPDGVPLASAAEIELEDGVVVSFSEGDYRVGDFWLIPARTAIDSETGRIEWPVVAGAPAAVPSRREVRACLLTMAAWNGTALSSVVGFGNCTPEFDPLPTRVAAGGSGPCTIVVKPGPGWEQPLLELPAGADAEICFPVGEFPTPSKGVTVAGKGRLSLRGAGPGTRIVNPAGPPALELRDCVWVDVRDMAVSAGGGGPGRLLVGALTIVDCQETTVDSVRLEIAGGGRERAAGLRVRNDKASNPPLNLPNLRVRSAAVLAGADKSGIVATGLHRVTIEDCVISGAASGGPLAMDALLASPLLVSRLRSTIARNVRVVPARETARPGEASFSFQGRTIAFTTAPELASGWAGFLAANPPPAGARISDAAGGVARLANDLLRNPDRWDEFPAIRDVVRVFREAPSLGHQGVCVAGSRLHEARLANNAIHDFDCGLHVGLSHRESAQGSPDVARLVRIEGNRIETQFMRFPQTGQIRSTRGIFCGNVESLLVTDNWMRSFSRFGEQVQGGAVTMHGHLGSRILVRGNRVEGWRAGFVFVQENISAPLPRFRQWLVTDNLVTSLGRLVEGGDAPAIRPEHWNLET